MEAKRDARGNCHSNCCFDPNINPYCCMARRSFGQCSGPCEGPCYIISCMLLRCYQVHSQKSPEQDQPIAAPPLE